MKYQLFVVILYLLFCSCESPFKAVIESPNGNSKVCFLEYSTQEWKSNTVVTCDCEKTLEQIIKEGNYLITKNKAFDVWEGLIEWKTPKPVFYSTTGRFKSYGSLEVDYVEVDTFPKMYQENIDNRSYVKVSQVCLGGGYDFCLK